MIFTTIIDSTKSIKESRPNLVTLYLLSIIGLLIANFGVAQNIPEQLVVSLLFFNFILGTGLIMLFKKKHPEKPFLPLLFTKNILFCCCPVGCPTK